MADSRNKSSTEVVVPGVAACLSRYVREGDSVVVGYSGGLDSTVLLHVASRLPSAPKFGLAALHVHHGLSARADEWAAICARTCHDLGVPLTVRRVTVPAGTGVGLEASARRVRHRAFADCPADWILLAHHADDQAETILHNLLRGAGVRGAAAIPEAKGRLLRPLLGLPRAALLAYARDHHLTWIEDESNTDVRYTRNFLRREILPLLASRFPRAGEQLAAAASRFSEAETLLDELAVIDLAGASREFPVPVDLLRTLNAIRSRNLLRAMLSWNGVQPPDQRRLNEFVRQVRTAGKDRHPRIDLPNYSLWCEAGMLNFRAAY